tara:strand:- start:8760 stop:9194 length:435 start_codon:yes stop_codon:yes gene_type:complete
MFYPNKPYGTVSNAPGVSYDQDGTLYNFHGDRVNINGDLIPDEPAPVKAAPKAKAPKARKADTVELAGFQVPAEMVEDQEPPDDFIVDGVNLSAYARGDIKVPFFKLKSIVNKEFGVKISTADDLHEVLIREGIQDKPDEDEAA